MSSYAVIWDDGARPAPMAGRLELIDGHALLIGNSPGKPRLREFDKIDVEAVEIVRQPNRRLAGRPTLAVALNDGTLLRIGELAGFGIVGEIAAALA